MSSGKMKCAVWNGNDEELAIEEWDIPEIDSNEVLIRTAYSGICASDLHLIKGEVPVKPPRIFGHELSGIVEKKGSNVFDVDVGSRVVAHPVGPCGVCSFCRDGRENLCLNMNSIITGRRQGSFSEYVIVRDKQVYQIPDELELEKAALVEPLAIALHAVERTVDLKPGMSAVVIGAGTIGLLLVSVLKKSGLHKVIVSDPVTLKRDIALNLGADEAIDPMKTDLRSYILDSIDSQGIDMCFEAVGSPRTIEQAFELLKPGGSMTIVGWASQDTKIKISPFAIYRKELRINGTFFSPYSFNRAIKLISSLPVEKIISNIVPLEKINDAIDIMKMNKGIKVLVKTS